MTTLDLGSVGTEVHHLVENIPSSISGATLLRMANDSVLYVERYTGASVGSTSIEPVYQGPVINLTAAAVLKAMHVIGVDASNLHLGEFSVSKGADSNLNLAEKGFSLLAKEQLANIGRRVSYFKANG